MISERLRESRTGLRHWRLEHGPQTLQVGLALEEPSARQRLEQQLADEEDVAGRHLRDAAQPLWRDGDAEVLPDQPAREDVRQTVFGAREP